MILENHAQYTHVFQKWHFSVSGTWRRHRSHILFFCSIFSLSSFPIFIGGMVHLSLLDMGIQMWDWSLASHTLIFPILNINAAKLGCSSFCAGENLLTHPLIPFNVFLHAHQNINMPSHKQISRCLNPIGWEKFAFVIFLWEASNFPCSFVELISKQLL